MYTTSDSLHFPTTAGAGTRTRTVDESLAAGVDHSYPDQEAGES